METASLHDSEANTAEELVDRQQERQHSALRVEIAELRGVIDGCLPPQRTDRHRALIAVLVGRLSDRLRTHFALEEERGTAEPVAAERLRTDHAAIAVEAARLIEMLRSVAAPPDAEAQTLRWLGLLHAHELAEEALEQRAPDDRRDAAPEAPAAGRRRPAHGDVALAPGGTTSPPAARLIPPLPVRPGSG